MKKLFLGLLCAVALAACGGEQPAVTGEEIIAIVPVSEAVRDGCRDWSKNLLSCRPYQCLYGAPGALMGKEIAGLQDGKCRYREQLSARAVLQCDLPENHIKDMAAYYDMAEMEEDVQISVMQLADGTIVYQELVDGRPVRTPLQQALASGRCVIKRLAGTAGQPELIDLQFGQGQDTENIIL